MWEFAKAAPSHDTSNTQQEAQYRATLQQITTINIGRELTNCEKMYNKSFAQYTEQVVYSHVGSCTYITCTPNQLSTKVVLYHKPATMLMIPTQLVIYFQNKQMQYLKVTDFKLKFSAKRTYKLQLCKTTKMCNMLIVISVYWHTVHKSYY